MVEKIQMDVNETLELDYLVEQISDNAVEIDDEPSSGSLSLTYISKNISVINPTEPGIYKLDIKGQTIEIEVTDIPDSGNLQANWDVQQQPESGGQTIDPLVDQSGNGNDATAVGAPTLNAGGFNGYDAASLDGTDDRWEVSISLSQPFTIYAVVEITDSTETRAIVRDASTTTILDYYASTPGWRVYAGSQITGTTDDTINIVTGLFDGANSVVEEEDTQTASGDAGTGAGTNLGIGGEYATSNNFFQGNIMQVMIYDAGHNSTTRSDVNNYLANRWGVTL
jgi:hypothetical protein